MSIKTRKMTVFSLPVNKFNLLTRSATTEEVFLKSMDETFYILLTLSISNKLRVFIVSENIIKLIK